MSAITRFHYVEPSLHTTYVQALHANSFFGAESKSAGAYHHHHRRGQHESATFARQTSQDSPRIVEPNAISALFAACTEGKVYQIRRDRTVLSAFDVRERQVLALAIGGAKVRAQCLECSGQVTHGMPPLDGRPHRPVPAAGSPTRDERSARR